MQIAPSKTFGYSNTAYIEISPRILDPPIMVLYLFEDFKDEDYNIWIHNFHQIERYVTEIKSYECKDERVNDFKKELLERIFIPIINSISRYRENQIRNDKVYKAFLKRVAGLINNEFNHIFHGEYSEIGKDLLKAVSKDSAKIAK